MGVAIELCKYYTTTGYPNFRPLCEKCPPKCRPDRASLKCHSARKDCPEYKPTMK